MSGVPVLVLLGATPWEGPLVAACAHPSSGLEVVRRCLDSADLVAAAMSGAAGAAVIGAEAPRLDTAIVRRLHDAGVTLVGVAAAGDAEAAATLRRCGVDDVVDITRDDVGVAVREIGSVLRARRAARVVGDESMTPQPPGDTPPRGRVVAVWGPAGAPGRTTVAVSLADEWVRRGQRVLVVDADTWAPSLGVVVGLADEGPGLASACRRALAGMLDPDALAPLLREVRPGLRVLPGLPRAGRWTEARAVAVAEVVSVAQRMADVVVLDIAAPLERDEELQFDTDAPGRNAATLTALDLADVVVVVGSCEPPALVRLVTGLDDLREVIGETPVRVVVTRVRESVAGRRPAAAVAEALHRHAGLDAVWCVADDRPALDAALRSGRTLAEAAPSSPARTALRSLAVELGDDLGLGSPAARQRTTSTSRRGDGVLHGGGAASRAAR